VNRTQRAKYMYGWAQRNPNAGNLRDRELRIAALLNKVAELKRLLERDRDILDEWNDGVDSNVIAKRYSVGRELIYKIARVNGGKARGERATP
jgi:hypothetical protein